MTRKDDILENSSKVSVIVPVYNAAAFLEKCVNSILEQSYRNIELILVNDGSTDASADICERYAEKDSHVVYVFQENSGVSAARNRGLDVATGDYIVFVDSDDKLKENAIELLCNHIKEKNADLAICGYELVYPKHVQPMEIEEAFVSEQGRIACYFADHFLEAIASSVWGKLYKRELIKHRFDKSITMGEDLLFNLHYLKNAHAICALKAPLYEYSQLNPNSLVRKYKIGYYEQDKFVCEEWIQWFESLGMDLKSTKKAYYHISRSFFAFFRYITENNKMENRLQLIENSIDGSLTKSIKCTLDEYNVIQKRILKCIIEKKYKRALRIAALYFTACVWYWAIIGRQ